MSRTCPVLCPACPYFIGHGTQRARQGCLMSYGLQQKHGQRIVLESGLALGSPMPVWGSHSRCAANDMTHPESCCMQASSPASCYQCMQPARRLSAAAGSRAWHHHFKTPGS